MTKNIIEIVSGYANGSRVKKIVLVVGDSSGVVGESIKMYFDIAAEGTICENADIEIEIIKSKLKCKNCGVLFEREPFSFNCGCGGEGEPTDIGREFYIKYIEVEN